MSAFTDISPAAYLPPFFIVSMMPLFFCRHDADAATSSLRSSSPLDYAMLRAPCRHSALSLIDTP